jgi:glycosyltransferase involved in cell wall biosynthesis
LAGVRIALIAAVGFDEHTGARTRALRIYRRLTGAHDVTLVGVSTTGASAPPDDVRYVDMGCRPDWAPLTARELATGVAAVQWGGRVNEEIDLVYSYNSWLHTPLISYAVSRRLGVPLVVGVNDHRRGTGLKGKVVNEWARRRVLNTADLLVLESETLRRNLVEFDVTPARDVVVPTGIDVESYHRPDIEPATAPTVFYVGRDKDLDLAIEAATKVRTRIPDVTFRFAGVDGDAYPEAADRPEIEFLGFVSEAQLHRELAQAHVCIVPYRDAETAGRPVKILEYMSARTCIVATDLPFNTQMIRDGENGILTDPTPSAFADGVVRALEAPALRTRLVEQAWEDVQQFSLAHMGELLYDALEPFDLTASAP